MIRNLLVLLLLIPSLANAAAFQYGGVRFDVANTATTAGTTTLTNASKQEQRFTGTTTQTVVLPDATTLSTGYWYTISNSSTGLVSVQASGGGALAGVPAGSSLSFVLFTNSTAAGVWFPQGEPPLSVASPDSGYVNALNSLETDGLQTQVRILVGDSGSGGVAGVAPAPSAGDGAAGKYLSATGAYLVPTGTGIRGAYVECDGSSQVLASTTPSWITSVGNISGGQCIVTITGGVFSAAPFCIVSGAVNATNDVAKVSDPTTSTYLRTRAMSAASGSDSTSYNYYVMCMPQ